LSLGVVVPMIELMHVLAREKHEFDRIRYIVRPRLPTLAYASSNR
jgi:hypothetical protein